jgi:hypothetical protein
VTLYRAIELYKEHERVREQGRKISHAHVVNTIFRIDMAKQAIADGPLSQLKAMDIERWVAHWTGRPLGKSGKPISADPASGLARCIRHFLDFCDAKELWTPCRRWTDAFKGTSAKKLRTDIEVKARGRGGACASSSAATRCGARARRPVKCDV